MGGVRMKEAGRSHGMAGWTERTGWQGSETPGQVREKLGVPRSNLKSGKDAHERIGDELAVVQPPHR
eukprot:5306515-Alexandrium_andersonii.AAC.1